MNLLCKCNGNEILYYIVEDVKIVPQTIETQTNSNYEVFQINNHNPHWTQQMWGINIWCAISYGHLIGPHFYADILIGIRYLDFLQNTLPELLENNPVAEWGVLVWQQDGAPLHGQPILLT